MTETKSVEKSSEKKSSIIKRKNVLKKMDPESAKLLASLKEKANKKQYGRKIRDSEILAKALSLVEQRHLQELQDATLSEKDRLHIAHEEFAKQHGKISLDQFIGRLLKGEIKT
jgi:hypothetical protein